MTFAVPEDLHKKMRKHDKIKWSAVCREAIKMKLEQLEQNETISLEEAHAIMEKIRKKHGHKLTNTTEEIRKWRDSRYSS